MPIPVIRGLTNQEKTFYLSFRKKLLEDKKQYQQSIKRGETQYKKSLTATNKNLKLLDDVMLFNKSEAELKK
tara:strand:+ start:944 stop:1159 length:216 start_codon:yes stop_codon:yes gene_type:complete